MTLSRGTHWNHQLPPLRQSSTSKEGRSNKRSYVINNSNITFVEGSGHNNQGHQMSFEDLSGIHSLYQKIRNKYALDIPEALTMTQLLHAVATGSS